jgi:Alpha/beta hydrolase family
VATFCLVHGAWHDDACWELLVAELERRGHECTTPVLPLEDAGTSFEDYAAVVIECLDGRQAPVLVGHSMSSAVIPLVATIEGWWPHHRAVSQLYGRLDTRLAARLRPQPQALFGAAYPLERPPEVPSACLYAREDELFDDEWSRWIARQQLGVEAIEVAIAFAGS